MTAAAKLSHAEADHILGTNLLHARVAARLTPHELAELAGVDFRVVNAIEEGRGYVLPVELDLIAAALGVPLEQLLRPAGSAATS